MGNKKIKIVLAHNTKRQIFIYLLLLMPQISWANDVGRICIAPLPKSTELQNPPWNSNNKKGLTDYYIKVNNRAPIQTSVINVMWIENISAGVKHTIKIFKGDSPKEQFTFSLDDYSFKKKSKKDLCLFVNSFYLTWQLYKVEDTGSWCPCWSSEGKK